jgi:hypothetical protein
LFFRKAESGFPYYIYGVEYRFCFNLRRKNRKKIVIFEKLFKMAWIMRIGLEWRGKMTGKKDQQKEHAKRVVVSQAARRTPVLQSSGSTRARHTIRRKPEPLRGFTVRAQGIVARTDT